MTYYWQFNKLHPSQKLREPIQGEFFAADAISNPGEALVREGIQNSLDARREGEKVIVHIQVSGPDDALPRTAVSSFLNGLYEHIKAPSNGLREIPSDSERCHFLIFEDFGTTGLLGDPAEWNPPAGSKNHFFHFFRADGLSNKSEKDIGRWGVGKQVFPRASRINSILGLTVRSNDGKKLLMGMSVLKSHDIKGVRYAPDGWLGCPSDDIEGFVLPIHDDAFIDAFSRTFDVQRGNDPGLTIVVPWCDIDLTDDKLIYAVIRGYFLPILHGKLEVIVETGSIKTILDKTSLETEIKKISGDLERDILPLVLLAKWADSCKETDYVLVEKPDPSRGWQWNKDLFTAESLINIRNKYDYGDRIAIRVPVTVREKCVTPRNSFFDIFMQRDGSEQNGRPVFIREGIIIPDVRAPFTRGVRALVIAEDGPITAFLGDSENPAHTQWQKDGANFRGKYVSGSTDLLFVMQSVYRIINIISEIEKKVDKTLLIDLFSVHAPLDDDEPKTREKNPTEIPGKDAEVPKPPESHPKPLIIDRIEDGFVVRNGKITDATLFKILSIRAAYHVRRGNPFKKYNPADFNFETKIKIKTKGLTILEKIENLSLIHI